MANDSPALQLIRIKSFASSCITKLNSLTQIKDTWESDEDIGIDQSILNVSLHCEYAMSHFDEIVTAAEQLLRSPPPYEPNPDDRRHRLLELQVLGSQAAQYAVQVKNEIALIREMVVDVPHMRLAEAETRGKTVAEEANSLRELAVGLCSEGDGGGAET